MIKTATISNFQSHKDTKLDLVTPGVNVIVGATDAGKSALFRALLWVCFNRPLGESMRSHWASNKEPTEVKIELTDRQVISRVKSSTINEYRIADLVLKAFGQDVPEEILNAHGMDRTLNVQSQIDPFFLLQSSAGEVATYLNQVAGLDDIDHVTRRVQTAQRRTNQDINHEEGGIQNLKLSLDMYEGLDDLGEQIEDAESIGIEIAIAKKTIEDTTAIINRIGRIEERVRIGRERISIKPEVVEALTEHDRIDALQDERNRLNRTVRSIKKMQTKLEGARARLENVGPLISEALTIREDIDRLYKVISAGWKMVEAIKSKGRHIEDTKATLRGLESQWHEAMPEGSECPLCGHIVES